MFFRGDDLFDDFEREFDQMSRLMDEMMENVKGLDWPGRAMGEPVYYGVSVNVGPDGVPHVERFGNVRPQPDRRLEPGIREPFMSAFLDDARGEIRVTAELPGVDAAQIKTEIKGDQMILRAQGEGRVYEKTMQLPATPDAKSLTTRYHNGVFEATMKSTTGA